LGRLRLYIMSRAEAADAVTHRKLSPTEIISIGDADCDDMPSVFLPYAEGKGIPLTRFQFDDVARSFTVYVPPSYEDVAAVVERERLEGDVLIHCAAGISRSTGMGLAIRASQQPGRTSADARRALWQIHDDVQDTKSAGFRKHGALNPNPRIVWHTDSILKYDGALMGAFGAEYGDAWADIGEQPGTISRGCVCEK
jgi:predicted protein tyrosine phosphatase